MKLNLEDLTRACQRHDIRAQRQLYEEFAPMMLGVCCRYTHNLEEAQDLLHDGFVKVFENIGHLKNPHAVEDWIYHVMVNTSVNYVKRHRFRFEPLPDNTDDPPIVVNTSSISSEDLAILIRQLPDPYQLVFNLREVEGEEFSDIASRLGIADNSVRSILSRAKKMLRDQINKL